MTVVSKEHRDAHSSGLQGSICFEGDSEPVGQSSTSLDLSYSQASIPHMLLLSPHYWWGFPSPLHLQDPLDMQEMILPFSRLYRLSLLYLPPPFKKLEYWQRTGFPATSVFHLTPKYLWGKGWWAWGQVKNIEKAQIIITVNYSVTGVESKIQVEEWILHKRKKNSSTGYC